MKDDSPGSESHATFAVRRERENLSHHDCPLPFDHWDAIIRSS